MTILFNINLLILWINFISKKLIFSTFLNLSKITKLISISQLINNLNSQLFIYTYFTFKFLIHDPFWILKIHFKFIHINFYISPSMLNMSITLVLNSKFSFFTFNLNKYIISIILLIKLFKKLTFEICLRHFQSLKCHWIICLKTQTLT